MATEPTPSFGPEQEERILLPLTLAESIGEGIVVIDRESRIRYVNEALTRIFGYSRDELLGSSLTQLMPERFRDEHRHSFGEYLVTGRRHVDWSEVELPGLHRDGSELSLRLSFTEFSSAAGATSAARFATSPTPTLPTTAGGRRPVVTGCCSRRTWPPSSAPGATAACSASTRPWRS